MVANENKTGVISVRLDANTVFTISAISLETGLTKSEICRRLIDSIVQGSQAGNPPTGETLNSHLFVLKILRHISVDMAATLTPKQMSDMRNSFLPNEEV